jgi:hypothetical protein
MNCPKCGIENPTTNQFCGKCGTAMQKKTSPVAIGCLAVIGIIVLIAVFSSGSGDKPTGSSSSSPSAASVPATPIPEMKPEPGSQWSYSSDEDKMGRKRSFAHVTSTNTLSFDFPYNGSQHGTLTIRKSARYGTEAIVSIERGQFLCGLDECLVNVRFDDGPIHQYSASGPADHGTTTLFLSNGPGFVAQLRKAKTARVEATFYQEGTNTLEFNVEGFK